ncbi:MAG: 50S ribosomal protein L11 methyltransferase [Proteobacteria bacterium]|nr:50S ribosomal protein L11 methyltransferase [Pseudomonadota bacterium]
MAWLAIRLLAGADHAEALSDALIEAGALSVTCDDADAGTAAEAPQFGEPGVDAPRVWPRNILTALVPADADAGSIVAAAAGACGLPPPAYATAPVEDADWVRTTQAQFQPIRVVENLWIVPSWCEPPDPAAVNISIDPGLAFGTGSHPTTLLMLRWLARTLKGGETLLDYGCGSGILAIVAARLGARDVIGVDIDPQAIIAANDNAAKNRVAARFFTPDANPDRTAEIVVANILANPLVVLAPLITARCARRVALSGVLESQAEQVMGAYSAHFQLEVSDREDGWVLITGVRR